MISLPYLAAINLRGKDAQRFLHGQVSADLLSLAVGDAGFACLCQPNGRVTALLAVQRQAESLQVLCARALADTVVSILSRYVLRDDVTITPDAGHVVFGIEAGEIANDQDVLVPLPGGLAYSVAPGVAPSEVQADQLAAWKMQELSSGVAWLDEHSSNVFLPQMLGYTDIGALSFYKGCFPGQEIIARTRYLGRLKQHPLRLCISGVLEKDADRKVMLYSGTQAAEALLVDQADDGQGRNIALLVVRGESPLLPDRISQGTNEFQAEALPPD